MTTVQIRRRSERVPGPDYYTDEVLDMVELDHAREAWNHVRVNHGFAPGYAPNLIQHGGNAKLRKSDRIGKPTYGLTLAPAMVSGFNQCSHQTPGCSMDCLFTAGRGGFNSVQRARIARTVFLERFPLEARALMRNQLRNIARRHGRKHWASRMNVTSDRNWSEPWYAAICEPAAVNPYAYTKVPAHITGENPAGIDYTWSVSEREPGVSHVLPLLDAGTRCAVVIGSGVQVPETVDGYPVFSMDHHDYRPADPVGIGVLTAKGSARGRIPSASGFVKSSEWFAA